MQSCNPYRELLTDFRTNGAFNDHPIHKAVLANRLRDITSLAKDWTVLDMALLNTSATAFQLAPLHLAAMKGNQLMSDHGFD
jgi:hypothetical protein